MHKHLMRLSLLLIAMGASAAHADLCLTFGSSTDLFRGNVTGKAPGGFFTLAMIEDSFDRAAFGSLVSANGKFRVSLTKNTNTAIVSYACQIDPAQLSGPCQIQVLTSSPLEGSRSDDVGFLTLGCSAADAVPNNAVNPPGE